MDGNPVRFFYGLNLNIILIYYPYNLLTISCVFQHCLTWFVFWYLGDKAISQRMDGFASLGIYRSEAAMGLTG